MAYEVIARKWRPQRFEDVVGQEHVTRTLQNAIEMERIAHAYLFVGPRGIGKTSIARIFAKALNCKKGPTTTPCGECDSCREITMGNSLDVLEIDGASNNGVEQVRELRDTVKYAPAHGKYKIFIIDEVHMLSQAAFNALLKTLEEPPAHVKFIFATTEPDKVLPTIVSRCQRFDLRRISVPLIVSRLKEIAQSEKVKADEDALLAIARGCEGGLRDAESALDQLIAFKGAQIGEEDVLSVFGLVSRRTLEELAESVLAGNMPGIIAIVGDLDRAGKDFCRLVMELMEHFRNLLVCLNVKDPAATLDLTEPQVEVLKRQATMTNTAKALRIAGILADAEGKIRVTLSRRTLLETALIRCARASVVVSIEEILASIQKLQAGVGAELPPSRDPGRPAGHEPAKGRSDVAARTAGRSAEAAGEEAVSDAPVVREQRLGLAGDGGGDECAMLTERWKEIIDKVGKIAVAARGILMDVRPTEVGRSNVILTYDPEFAEDDADRFGNARVKQALEHVLAQVLHRDVAVEFKAGKASEEEGGPAVSEGATRPEGYPAAKPAPKGGKGKTSRDWMDDPTVRKVLDTFGGTIMDVRE